MGNISRYYWGGSYHEEGRGGTTEEKQEQGVLVLQGPGLVHPDSGMAKRRIALVGEDGKHLKDPATKDAAEAAYQRFVLAQKQAEKDAKNPKSKVTLFEVCHAYLDYTKDHGHKLTHSYRGRVLYDFLTGFPGRFWLNGDEPQASDRIHAGYGDKLVSNLTPADIQEWFDAHPTWHCTATPLQAILRALNYAWRTLKLIPANPIRGMPRQRPGRRDTYFTPEVEEAIYKFAKPYLALAVKVCIRTGARPGIEFASLEARHVQETEQGQVWKFPAAEAKGRRKPRTIYVPEEIAGIVRKQIKLHPKGKVFRGWRGVRGQGRL